MIYSCIFNNFGFDWHHIHSIESYKKRLQKNGLVLMRAYYWIF